MKKGRNITVHIFDSGENEDVLTFVVGDEVVYKTKFMHKDREGKLLEVVQLIAAKIEKWKIKF